MPVARVQHIYHGISALPKDLYVNTWYFRNTGPLTATEAASLVNYVQDFYNTATGQTKGIFAYHAFPSFAGLHTSYKVYNMSLPAPRPPIVDMVPSPLGSTNLAPTIPAEVAMCMSYNGAPAAGTPPGRIRGRLFLGPLNTNAMVTGADGICRPHSDFTSDVRIAAKRMAALALAGGWTWCGWSETTAAALGPPPVAGNAWPGTYAITSVSTDNAFDTQRRRGAAPVSRNATAIP